MTCRHDDGDLMCSTKNPAKMREEALRMWEKWGGAEALPGTPDAERFHVVRAEPVGGNLVVEVEYPNCAKCAYEGHKVMVFLGVTLQEAIRWRVIDPHFRPPSARGFKEAPSPAARFPATTEGWVDALAFAKSKS